MDQNRADAYLQRLSTCHNCQYRQERDRLLNDLSSPEDVAAQATKTMQNGRPDFRAIVDEVFSYSGRERVAVLVCGPRKW